jgi:glycyl-tRNA synthetase beta chain
MNDLIFEIYSEEIPARFLASAHDQFYKKCLKAFATRGITYDAFDVYVTPHRLGLFIKGMLAKLPSFDEEKRGPKVGSSPKAVDGFLKSQHITFEQCVERDGYIYATIHHPERPVNDVFQSLFDEVLTDITFPKTMRWPQSNRMWARPVRRIICVFDQKVVPLNFFSLTAYAHAKGHRLSDEPHTITSIEAYERFLEKEGVVLFAHERKKKIHDTLLALLEEKGLHLLEDDDLLTEVSGLSETCVVKLGQMDVDFLSLPLPVIQTAMKTHQKYFTLLDQHGRVAPYFAYVADKYGTSSISQKGYENVLRARLSDARFFYDNDRKVLLENRVESLKKRLFHEKLGTLYDKVKRLEKAAHTPITKRAALLCKSDLMSDMVNEFPEIQGIMGGIYADSQGEQSAVCRAISTHYQPVGLYDHVPDTEEGLYISILDKLDTLVGFFGINLSPSASKDPFALRRCALGIVRCMIEGNIKDIQLFSLTHHFKDLYAAQGVILSADVCSLVMNFILERMRHYLKETVSGDILRALEPASLEDINLWRIHKRATVLHTYLTSPSGVKLMESYTRAHNISSKHPHSLPSFEDFSHEMSEIDGEVYKAIVAMERPVSEAIQDDDYEKVMDVLANLQPLLSEYFDTTLIMAEDEEVKKKRLSLLNAFVIQCHRLADFSKIS